MPPPKFKERAGRVEGPGVYRVANVRKSTCDHNDWNDKWTKATGIEWKGMKCQIDGCRKNVEAGGHMYVEGKSPDVNYILPICQSHNKAPDLHCDANRCSRYILTKETYLLPMAQKGCVYDGQNDDPVGDFGSMSLGSTKEVNGTRACDAIFNETGAFIMFTMTNCPACRDAKPYFEEHADSHSEPHYILKNKRDNASVFKQCGVQHVPAFFQVSRPGQLRKIQINNRGAYAQPLTIEI